MFDKCQDEQVASISTEEAKWTNKPQVHLTNKKDD